MTGWAPTAAATWRASSFPPPAWPARRVMAYQAISSRTTTPGSDRLSSMSGARSLTAAPTGRMRTMERQRGKTSVRAAFTPPGP
jgi:hypothetical protein